MYEGDMDDNNDWSADIAVELGVMVLNDKGPTDWRQRINLTTMNVANSEQCPLTQVFGGYLTALETLDIHPANAIDFGFDCHGSDIDELNDAWREELGA